ncbi:ABC-2 type transport system ATP-binding protein [Nocardia mexicana]|uniref:ABC-2 type transport system ATP-binding protein n=1 Tax=Nocardia mexicana TaxID=279262 RepID=A0A370GNG5_9NOCA|nr:ABC transporter ATP-binding protein [Nocardia mexicana]RDI43473.1 ABC-2 type transport system ATP-binding protein [Nocardia mexicana]
MRGVSISVGPGEIFALLGTNGAGKTSTLEVLEGLAKPSFGSVRILGMDPWAERRELRPYIGIMLQEGGFSPDLTVAETISMWAKTLSGPLPAATVIEMVGIEHRKDTPVRQLSGGERRRLDLALTVLNRPDVIFLDEPTTGLDPESRRNTWELIRRLRDEGATVLLTTHYLDEAEQLAKRLAIMHGGVIVREGAVEDVIASYPARIRFREPGVVIPARLTGQCSSENGDVVVETDALQETLTDLLIWARENSISLSSLEATPASLESIFLSLAESSTDRPAEVMS